MSSVIILTVLLLHYERRDAAVEDFSMIVGIVCQIVTLVITIVDFLNNN